MPPYPISSAVIFLAAALGLGVYVRSTPRAYFSPEGARLYTTQELQAVARAMPQRLILLVVVGRVYNVTAGRGYYALREGYEGFAKGMDASRAFLDTQFDREGLDDLANLTLSECYGIGHWSKFYESHEQYTISGLHVGRFYNLTGQPTDERRDFEACVENAGSVIEVLKGFAASADEHKCEWQHVAPKSVACKAPRVPMRMELPEQGMQCVCLAAEPVLALVAATAKRPPGNFLPRPYDGCTLDESKCALPDSKTKAPAEA